MFGHIQTKSERNDDDVPQSALSFTLIENMTYVTKFNLIKRKYQKGKTGHVTNYGGWRERKVVAGNYF